MTLVMDRAAMRAVEERGVMHACVFHPVRWASQ